jgi:molybdate-binding protein
VDGRWIAHGIDDGARAGDGLLAGDPNPLGEVSVEPLVDPGALVANVLVSGCAPLLGLLTARLGRRGPGQRATWIPAGSGRSLELLERGEVHLAGLHLVEVDSPGGHAPLVRERFPDRASLIVNLTRWRQGLVVAPGNPRGIEGVADLLREDLRFVGREPGSGAERLVTRLLDELGLCAGSFLAPATTHAEVARRVRWGAADFGVAIEAAAIAEGLDFIPLAEERFDLLVPRERAELPEVARLLELIDRRSFRSEAAQLPGYDLREAGHAATVEARAHA